MAKSIRHVETLEYFDGAQLFVGTDSFDTIYLCLLSEKKPTEDIYICVPLSRAELKSVKIGERDLFDIYYNPQQEEIYQLVSSGLLNKELCLQKINPNTIPSSWLPEKGCYLEPEILPNDSLQLRATDEKRAILYLSLNPPESRDIPKINTENLVRTLSVFQSFVMHAFKKTLKSLDKKARMLLDDSLNYGLEVTGMSPGSFTIQLQSKSSSDMFGNVELGKAFEIIDELVGDLNDEEKTLEIVRKYKGHLANVFIRLLELIIENDIPLHYQWTMPALDKPRTGKIIRNEAAPVYKLLSATKELGIEKIELIGYITSANAKTGKWTLYSEEDKKEYHGEIPEPPIMILDGIVIKSIRYKLSCEEIIEEIAATGKEKKRLSLIKYKVL